MVKEFAEEYPDFPFVQVPLAQITWYHHISMLPKVKDMALRAFYMTETAIHGWSRDIMLMQISDNYHQEHLRNRLRIEIPKSVTGDSVPRDLDSEKGRKVERKTKKIGKKLAFRFLFLYLCTLEAGGLIQRMENNTLRMTHMTDDSKNS